MQNRATRHSRKTQRPSAAAEGPRNDHGLVKTSILGGRVSKITLPSVHGRPGPDAPPLKRLFLAQGELSQLWDADCPIHYIAFLELRPGTVRGNHFHRLKREFFYVIAGEAILFVQDVDSGLRDRAVLASGDLAEIPPGVAHCFQVSAAGQALEFSPNRFNPVDIYPLTQPLGVAAG